METKEYTYTYEDHWGNTHTVQAAAVCDGCGIRGVVVDTPAGEIVRDGGRVIAQAPHDAIYLMAGKADGSCTEDLYCQTCALDLSND